MTKRAQITRKITDHAGELRHAVEVSARERGDYFKKGAKRPENAGRKAGTPNKVTALLKDALIHAAEAVGSDGKGTDGLVGYLATSAVKERAAYLRLLEKLLPYQLTGKDGGPMQLEHSTSDQLKERLKERGIPVVPSLMDAPAASKAVN
jgi:hypothetical protein